MNHSDPEKRHTLAALLGRFKTETGEKYHLMPLVARETASGLKPGLWMERMLEWFREQGIGYGPVFRSSDGDRAKALDFQVPIFEKLLEIQLDLPELISRDVDVVEEYGLSCLFRRGADTRAVNAGVWDADVDLNCRWRTVENSKGKSPQLRMQHHYAEVKQMLASFLRFSKAL
jgi:hypothetical protein